MKWISKSEKDTRDIAKYFINKLTPAPYENSTRIIAMIGELGSGKTTFVKYCAKYLGINSVITSPTFVILKSYPIKDAKLYYKKMIHIDAYRLNKESNLEIVGIDDAITEPYGIVFIEWADRIGLADKKYAIKLEFTHINETTRMIEMSHN
jgi:tRNA threonylcarbamoyladenosine biosynthesis protein TsaE